MANFAYTPFATDLLSGVFNLTEGIADVRAILVMTNTTADTDRDVEFVGDITTLDEYDGANYARKVMANQVVTEDDPNNRGEFSADPFTYTALGAGTRNAQGLVFYVHSGADATNKLLFYSEFTPFNGNGGDVTITPNAQGLLQTQA